MPPISMNFLLPAQFSSRGHLGARGVSALPMEQSPYCADSRRSARLVPKGIHAQNLHLSGSPRLHPGHARGLQRSVHTRQKPLYNV